MMEPTLGALLGFGVGLLVALLGGLIWKARYARANRQDAELTIELFVLDPEPTPADTSATGQLTA